MAILPIIGETDPIIFTNASAGGDEFDNAKGVTGLQIFNSSGGPLRVQFKEQRDCSFGDKENHLTRIVTVAAGAKIRIPRFQIWRYNNSFDRVEMTYPDGVTDLQVAALDRPCL